MKLNRRQFIQAISAGTAAALVFDPEKLLWVPGAKKIFIPPPRQLIWSSVIPMSEFQHNLELIRNLPISDKFLYEIVETENLVQLYYGYVK